MLDAVEMTFTTPGLEGGLRVLDGVSATVDPGRFACIVGPSGCGKSTLLRLIAGLEPPTGGTISVAGVPVTRPSRDIGFVFQQFSLLPWRTVRRNVEFGMESMRISRSERRRRADDWLRTVDLHEFADRYPAQLSGGMQQRVGLARALAIEPHILLMDEPFGSLDSQTRMLLQAELLRIWERDQKTVVFITHDIEEALFLADTVYVMGPRPSRIMREVEVPFARPRDDRLRANPRFAELREEIWENLKAGIKAS